MLLTASHPRVRHKLLVLQMPGDFSERWSTAGVSNSGVPNQGHISLLVAFKEPK